MSPLLICGAPHVLLAGLLVCYLYMLCRDGREAENGEVTLQYDEPRWKRMAPLEEVVMSLASKAMLPAIYFIFSRAACDEAALMLDKQGVSLTTPDEQMLILYELESLR